MIHSASSFISASSMPRVVAAGLPRRMPLGRRGGRGSSGINCLLTVIETLSSVSSPIRPSIPKLFCVSSTIMWLSVPPVTSSAPRLISSSASTFALVSTCRA